MNKLLAILLLFTVLTACRKGEEDPSFTLATRKKRLSGEWMLQESKVFGTFSKKSPDFSDYKFTSNKDGFTYHLDSSPTATIYSGNYELRLAFKDDGKMSLIENLGGLDYTLEGSWDFLGKGSGYKNKERLIIVPQNVTKGTTGQWHPLFASSFTPVFRMRELSKSRLTLLYNGDGYFHQHGELVKVTVSSEFVFTK